MDRLTNPNGDGFIACNGCTKPMCTDCEEFKKQAAKMAEYENTGLTPAEVAELAQVNEQLKELLRLAVGDMKSITDKIANSHELLADGNDEVRNLHLGRCDVCNKNCHNDDDDSNDGCNFTWQHADKMKGLVKG